MVVWLVQIVAVYSLALLTVLIKGWIVGAWLPPGMGFNDINHNEVYLVAVLSKQSIGGSDPLPEGTSGVGASNQHYWLILEEAGQRVPDTLGAA